MQAGNIYFTIQFMVRAYIANAREEERSALRLMLLKLHMEVVGGAPDWLTTLSHAPTTNFNMLIVDWELLPENATTSLSALRRVCSDEIVIILTSQLDARQQAAESTGADAFISKGEIPNRIADRLRAAGRTLGARVNT